MILNQQTRVSTFGAGHITHTRTDWLIAGDKESGALPAAQLLPDLVIGTRHPDRQPATTQPHWHRRQRPKPGLCDNPALPDAAELAAAASRGLRARRMSCWLMGIASPAASHKPTHGGPRPCCRSAVDVAWSRCAGQLPPLPAAPAASLVAGVAGWRCAEQLLPGSAP